MRDLARDSKLRLGGDYQRCVVCDHQACVTERSVAAMLQCGACDSSVKFPPHGGGDLWYTCRHGGDKAHTLRHTAWPFTLQTCSCNVNAHGDMLSLFVIVTCLCEWQVYENDMS